METLTNYLSAIFSMIAESAPFLLLGFFIAGLLRVLIPQKKITRYLGGDGFRSVALASIFGVPLPLCSCSVLPTAAELRKSGAGKGATTSFLISTPETGVDSIGITWALLDPLFTIVRPLAALLTALVTGSLVNSMVKAGWDRADEPAPEPEACGTCASEVETNGKRSPREVLIQAWRYAFGPLLDDLTPWFLLGFMLSGLLAVVIPDGFFAENVPPGVLGGLIMAAVATPMYICAAAATPLAAVLIAKGLDPGAALVFLLVGPATNFATILVVHRLLGRRVLIAYLVGIVVCALILGAVVSGLYAESGMDLPAAAAGLLEEGQSPVAIVLGVFLLGMLLRSALRTGLFGRLAVRIGSVTRPFGFDPSSRVGRAVIVVLLVAVYASTCFSMVGPGEIGWVVRFGRVVRTVSESGLVVHAPAPFERLTTLAVEEVRTVELGHVRGSFAPPRDLADQAEVITGEENLLRISYTVHYDVADPWRYHYRVADAEDLVRAFAESTLRQALADRDSAWVLVGHRSELQTETHRYLQAALDDVESGVRVRAFALEDVHAAPRVHPAYRDVASALEDRQTSIREAEGDRMESIANARGRAYRLVEEAQGVYLTRVEKARGDAAAFLSKLAAYRESPVVTRLRMVMDAAEDALRSARSIFLLGADIDLELWKVDRREGPIRIPPMEFEVEEPK